MCGESAGVSVDLSFFPNRVIKELPKALEKFVKYNMEVERLHNFSSISLLHTFFLQQYLCRCMTHAQRREGLLLKKNWG